MPITGVYFIPAHPNSTTALPAITERLRSTFTDSDLIPISRWALEHKLMRDTPGLLASAQRTQKPRYMQFLSLTHYPSHGFVYTSEPAEKPFHPPSTASPTPPPPGTNGVGASAGAGAGMGMAVPPQPQPTSAPMSATSSQTGPGTAASQSTTTPANDLPPMQMTTLPPASFSTLFHHVTYACQPFWCHRMTVAVPNGVVYDVGDFRVRLGDVRQTYPAGRVRGTVVEIEWRGPSVVDSVTALSMSRGRASSDPGHGAGAGGGGDADSGVDVSFEIEEADVEAEYVATAALIRGFWDRFGVEGAREAILVPGVGKEVKERLARWRERGGREEPEMDFTSFGPTELDVGYGVGSSGSVDPVDMLAGVDLARQYMEVLRFNR